MRIWAGCMSESILSIRGIHTFIEQFHILEGVSVEVPANSITVLLGRNGAGKTTTLRTVMGLNPPQEGSIFFRGKPIHGLRAFQIGQLGVGYVPDHRAIFRKLSVEQNLRIAERKPHDLEAKLELIFDIFPDLKRLYQWPGGQLSGGQQQMLAVARALVPNNRLLLVDEPTEGLAPIIIEQMMHAIQQLKGQTTVLLVEQNFLVAERLADYYSIIEDGRSVHSGLMANLADNDELINRYLGAA